MNKQIHSMECYSLTKRNELLIQATSPIHLKKHSGSQKQRIHTVSFHARETLKNAN